MRQLREFRLHRNDVTLAGSLIVVDEPYHMAVPRIGTAEYFALHFDPKPYQSYVELDGHLVYRFSDDPSGEWQTLTFRFNADVWTIEYRVCVGVPV